MAEFDDKEPSDEQTRALATFFSEFDGEAILMNTGILSQLQPRGRDMLRAVSTCIQAGRDGSPPFSPQQLINILSTTVLLGYYDVPLKDKIVVACLPHLPELPPTALAQLCYALGIAGYSDHEFMVIMERVLTEKAKDFDVKSLAKCIWMFGRAHYNSSAVADLVDGLLERAKADDTSPSDLIYCLWACAIHDEYDEGMAERIISTVPPHVPDLEGPVLAKLAFGIVQEDIREPELLEAIAAAAPNALNEMWPRDVAKLAYALGQAQVGGRELASVFGPHVERHLHAFTQNELDMIMETYNRWGVHDETCMKVANLIAH